VDDVKDPTVRTACGAVWLADYAATTCAPKTAERYGEMLECVTRRIGNQPLTKLTALQLRRLYNELLKSGKKDGGPLSLKSVRNVRGVVHSVLETAVEWQLLKTNPAHRIKLPKVPARKKLALDFTQTRSLLASSSASQWADLLVMEVATGMRRGEALSLTWADVDFDASAITISKSLEQLKTGLRIKQTKGNNIRTVPLAQDAVEALRRIQAAQEKNREAYGTDYRTDLDLVFAQPDGNFVRPDVATKAGRRLAKRAGFARASLHTLRHSYGSQLLSAGVPLPVVSEMLGHADVYTTAKIYSHSLESDRAEVAEKWQAAMKKAEKSKVIAIPRKIRTSGAVANGSTKPENPQEVIKAKLS
jgi:integrase